MKYLTPTRVQLQYDLPLSEIVYDFYDKLKSYSKGHASMDYEYSEHRSSDLAKLDIKLNGEKWMPSPSSVTGSVPITKVGI